MKFSDFINECKNHSEISLTHFIYLSNKEILFEYCSLPYKKDCLRLFFSMTKSLSSLAIGIASDMKLLQLDDPIVKIFQSELPQNPHKNLEKITIKHLLTMSSGIHDNTYSELFLQENWIKAFLSQEFPHEPGKYYRYSTHGSHMLSAIISKVSGLSLEDFLNLYLFHPMKIYEAQWESSPEGLTAGGMGLSLYPMSLAKIAQMLLNDGIYNDIRLISSDYLKEATISHIIKQDENIAKIYSGNEYGYQFHIGKDKLFRADGAFGQLCLICPAKNVAVIVFSQFSKTEALLAMIYKYFIDNETPIIRDKYILEDNKIVALKPCTISNFKYKIEDNLLNVSFIEFSSNEKRITMTTSDGRESIIHYDFENYTSGKSYFIKDLQEHLQEYTCCISNSSENLIELKVYYIETPYVAMYRLKFNEDEIELDFKINVNMTLNNFSVKGIRIGDDT